MVVGMVRGDFGAGAVGEFDETQYSVVICFSGRINLVFSVQSYHLYHQWYRLKSLVLI